MSNFELGNSFNELHQSTLTNEGILNTLESKYEEKGIEFDNPSTKTVLGASVLVNEGFAGKFTDMKKGVEKSLSRGASIGEALKENKNELGVVTRDIPNDKLNSPDALGGMIGELEKGNVFVYENDQGESRIIYGANVEPRVVDGETRNMVAFRAYGENGDVDPSVVKGEIKSLLTNGGGMTEVGSEQRVLTLEKTPSSDYEQGRSM